MDFGGMKPWVCAKATHTVRFTCKALEDPDLSAQTILHLHPFCIYTALCMRA